MKIKLPTYTREETIEDFAKSEFESQLNAEVRKLKWVGRVGAPDTCVMLPGGTVWFVEYKSPGQPLKAHQKREIRRMRRKGTTTLVLDTREDVLRLVHWYIKRQHRPDAPSIEGVTNLNEKLER